MSRMVAPILMRKMKYDIMWRTRDIDALFQFVQVAWLPQSVCALSFNSGVFSGIHHGRLHDCPSPQRMASRWRIQSCDAIRLHIHLAPLPKYPFSTRDRG